MIQKFEDLIAWQKGQDLAVDIYTLFSINKDYGFRNQICDAVVSISNNIAEGFERGSKASFAHFLKISKGSCVEVKSMTHLAARIKYINKEERDEILEKCNEELKILNGLIKSLK
ncbi:four helix bundle protein [Taibaiella lutea]|uniref:Four helix bundle protein n=1 Tax=Taibaiella lutea TaxID=2608001 RepID=A0A5M6CCC2_9BACT|nr:four helix bundle protein [Taibaiella lutea]KAA5532711.1 four helix bundle protein [Taibaiella lutea]